MGPNGSPIETLSDALLVPVLVVLFACGTVGSFVIWQLRVWSAEPSHHVPFELHLLHGEDRRIPHALAAAAIGLIAFLLPLTLIVRLAG